MRTWILATLALALAVLEKGAAVPIAADSHLLLLDRRAVNPEADALSINGVLPNGTETVNGYALEASTYPNTVSKALRAVASRAASPEQVSTLTYYATLSANTYCRTVIAGAWICPHCSVTSDLKIIDAFNTLVLDTNAIVVRGDKQKTISVAFRGTSSIENSIADMVFLPVSYSAARGATVHKGFLDSYNAVQAGVFAAVQAQLAAYPDYAVSVTGHSLGGATALLCALDLHQKGIRTSLYTYGQPRVGNPAFANYVVSTGIPYARTVNQRDLVPHVPPASFGFVHAGQEFWIKAGGSVDVCNNGIETSECSNSIVPFTSALDHVSYFGINCGLCL